jgi:transcriptional regulator with XRE-family HTH domain
MLLTNLKPLRKARGFNQTQLAQQVGVSPGMVSYLESGKRLPSFGLTFRLALTLGVGLDDLIHEPVKDNHAA